MLEVTREQIHLYLDNSLTEAEAARVEKAIRSSSELKQMLRSILADRDRGEHSVGAIWRRGHLSCPTREQLGSFLLRGLDDDLMDYIRFHLETINCPYCQANLEDLKSQQVEPQPKLKARRRRIFESSVGLIKPPPRRQ